MMLKSLLSLLRLRASNDTEDNGQRRFERRSADECVVDIAGKIYPVKNWSFGGVLINADDRLFGQRQNMDITLKFRLRENNLHKVKPHGSVVRKGAGKVAFEFDPLDKPLYNAFQHVIDDFNTRQLAGG